MAATRQLYRITIEALIGGEEGQADETLDITTYLTDLRVVKSLRSLIPMIGVTLSPSVKGVLKNGVDAYTRLRIKLDKMKIQSDQSIPELNLFDTIVYPAKFSFTPSLAESDSANEQSARAPLSFLTIPIYFAALYAHNINKLVGVDEPIELQKVVEEHLIPDAFEDGLVKLNVKKNINDFTNKQKLVRHLIHKTSFIDYLRYLSQRYGFYEGGTIFYTDFGYSDLDDKTDYDCILNLFNTKELEDPKYRLVFKSTNKEVTSGGGDTPTYYVYNMFVEHDNRVDAWLKLRTDLWWQYYGRDSFFLDLKEPKPLKEAQALMQSGKATESEKQFLSRGVIPAEHIDLPYLDNIGSVEAGDQLQQAADAIANIPSPQGGPSPFQQAANFLSAMGARQTQQNPPPDPLRRFKTMSNTNDNDYFYKTYASDRFLDSRNLTIVMDQFFPVEYINPAKLVIFECQDALYSDRYNGTYMISDCDFRFTRAAGSQDSWTVTPMLTLTRGFAQAEGE